MSDFYNSPLISIITPCYNSAKHLPETIDSVLGQTYSNWEWIIVDDCSSDASYSIAKEVAERDGRIIIIRNDVNLKAYASRNKGIEKASGNFLAFLDADDLWASEKLEEQLRFMQMQNCLFSYTAFSRFKDELENKFAKVSVPTKAKYSDIIHNNFIATSTVMINTDGIGKFYMKNVYYDDFTLWLELLKRIPFACGLNKNLMSYRVTTGSLSSNKIKSAFKVYDIFVNHLDFSPVQARYHFILWAANTLFRYLKYIKKSDV